MQAVMNEKEARAKAITIASAVDSILGFHGCSVEVNENCEREIRLSYYDKDNNFQHVSVPLQNVPF